MYDGYVLNSELSKEAGVATCLFRQMQSVEMISIGTINAVKKLSLPEKYKSAAERCTDLKEYTTATELSSILGMGKAYILCYQNYNNVVFESKKIGGLRLIKLPTEFIDLYKKGKTPFVIQKNEEDAEYIVEMQSLKIGFY